MTYVALSFLLNPSSPFLGGRLTDSDDYMRFVQVFNWLDGQGWHDLRQPRLNPGEDFVLGWSRLPDLPLAGGVWALTPWFGRVGAALMTAFIVPLLLLGAFLSLVPLLARPLLPRARVWLLPLLALFSLPLLREFSPMRVDHHAWHLLVATGGMICLLRQIVRPQMVWALVAAAIYAVGLWIGAETTPWLMAFSAVFGVFAAIKGGVWIRHAALFGVALAVCTILLLPVARAPDEWLVISFYRLSLAHVVFTSLIAVLFVAFWILGGREKSRFLRFGLLACLAFGVAGVFFMALPLVQQGIYAEMSDDNVRFILRNVIEAQSGMARLNQLRPTLASFAAHMPLIGQNMIWPLLGLATVLVMIVRSHGKRREIWLAYAAFLVPACALLMFWQMRVALAAHLFALAPIGWLLEATWRCLARRYQGRVLFAAEFGAFLMLVPTAGLILPALADGRPLLPNILLYPAQRQAKTCDMRPVAAFLNEPDGLGARPQTIMTTMSGAAELLFRTQHSLFSAPYNTQGNRIAYDFFSTHDEAQARRILRDRQADLVLVCKNFASLYVRDDKAAVARLLALSLHQTGTPVPPDLLAERAMIDRLNTGDAPDWLEPVALPFTSDFRLYRVKRGTGDRGLGVGDRAHRNFPSPAERGVEKLQDE